MAHLSLPSLALRALLLNAVLSGWLLAADDDWPPLPEQNAAVEIPAQTWPQRPGPRRVRIRIHYPGGKLENVGPRTGVMLTLHNWGGTDCAGTASPAALADRLDVVAVCVNYLQSGRQASINDPEPYDFGYLQALDALRALWYVSERLEAGGHPFDNHRTFACGGSGGGNVTLMANKLAPRTFACIVDMCGMKKLSHDIAFNLPGGTGLDARYRRDRTSRNYLSPDAQAVRFVGHPRHLATMKRLGNATKIFVVHGTGDTTCPFADAKEMVANMQAAKLDVVPHFLTQDDLDGRVFTSTGHALGNRTEIVFRVAGEFLSPTGERSLRRAGPSDFERRDEIRYRTPRGAYVISYQAGYPVGRFVADAPPVEYDEHQQLNYYRGRDGKSQAILTTDDWQIRRRHILANFQRVAGRLPGAADRVPLDVKTLAERTLGAVRMRKVSFQSDAFDRVGAWLLLPPDGKTQPARAQDGKTAQNRPPRPGKLPAVLCLHQTTKAGKDEPVGLAGSDNMHYAFELARRGYVVLAPDYPSLGEHQYDFAAHPEYASGTMKAIWDNVRAVDLLVSLDEVDAKRIGVIGHSLGGHGALFTALFEPRLKVIVSSCGFSRFHKDDVPSWTGPRYMPRIASDYDNDADRLPFDFSELVAGLAPRPFYASAPTRDRDFDATGVRDVIASARPVYELFDCGDQLRAHFPEGPHDFAPDSRRLAYAFLDRYLMAANREDQSPSQDR